jgi:2-succinyl-6-hydroxy-2,4-cyclohexadiene-1-carboxylate synthase
VRALILISAGFGLADPKARAERRERDRALGELLRGAGLQAFVDAWEDQPLFATQRSLPAALREAERERRLGHSAEGLAHSLACTGLAEMPDYHARLHELDLPVELICGADDRKFCDAAESVVSQLPRGRFTRVERAGHNLLLERPDAVEAAILRGLSS